MTENEEDASTVGGTASSTLTQADLDFWARVPGWTVREQAALLLGLNPENSVELTANVEFRRLRLMLQRAKKKRRIAHLPVPKEVLEWAHSNRIPVGDELRQAVVGARRLVNWRLKYKAEKRRNGIPAEESLPAKTRNSLERILLVVAMTKYKHDLNKKRSPAPSAIQSDADRLGNKIISADAIRDRLSEAAENHGDLFQHEPEEEDEAE